MEERLDALQYGISHRFAQVKLLTAALTHSSFANEQAERPEDNERLEFLGDAVLELCVSEKLFALFPTTPEGLLTRMRSRLVAEPALAVLARELGVREALLLGKGEENQGGRERPALLADAMEAVFGAVFLDGGYAAAARVVDHVYRERWPREPLTGRPKDPKSRLQEETQRLYKDRPVYALAGSQGPEHEKTFTVELVLPDGRRVAASGPSIKRAEHLAAEEALRMLFLGDLTWNGEEGDSGEGENQGGEIKDAGEA